MKLGMIYIYIYIHTRCVCVCVCVCVCFFFLSDFRHEGGPNVDANLPRA